LVGLVSIFCDWPTQRLVKPSPKESQAGTKAGSPQFSLRQQITDAGHRIERLKRQIGQQVSFIDWLERDDQDV
jgi:hypothetical protein